GNDHDVVAGGAMFSDQFFTSGQNDWLDIVMHKLLMPLLQAIATSAPQNFLTKVLVGNYIQFTGQIVGIKLVVTLLVLRRIHIAIGAQKLAPQVIAVTS